MQYKTWSEAACVLKFAVLPLLCPEQFLIKQKGKLSAFNRCNFHISTSGTVLELVLKSSQLANKLQIKVQCIGNVRDSKLTAVCMHTNLCVSFHHFSPAVNDQALMLVILGSAVVPCPWAAVCTLECEQPCWAELVAPCSALLCSFFLYNPKDSAVLLWHLAFHCSWSPVLLCPLEESWSLVSSSPSVIGINVF